MKFGKYQQAFCVLAENEKFTGKGVKASATRARKALQEMGKLIKSRRKEIIDEKAALTK